MTAGSRRFRRRKRSNKSDKSIQETMIQFFQAIYQISKMAYDAAPRFLILTVVIRILQSLLPIATAWVSKLIFDQLGILLQGDSDINFVQDIQPLLLVLGFLLVMSQAMVNIDSFLNQELGRRVILHTSQLMYTHLISIAGLHYFESPEFHDTIREAGNSLRWIPAGLTRQVSALFGSIITLIGFMGVILVISPALALILTIATIPSIFAQLYFRRKRFEISWENSPKQRKSYYLSSLLSATAYAKEIRLFNLGSYFLDQYIDTTKDVHHMERGLNLSELRINTGLGLLRAIVTIGTYFFVIGQAFAQTISLGDVTLYIEAVRNVQSNLEGLAMSIINLSERTLFFTHYQKLISTQSKLAIPDTYQDIPPLQHNIVLDNVGFRYQDDSPWIIKNLSLEIRKNESLALVGLNGAGKTTLVKLLARFYDPTEGQILWDGIDIRLFRPEDLRQRLGAIFQDFVRYDLTARENIGLGDVEFVNDLNRIQHVAQAVGVDEFIKTLPQEYETILSRWMVQQDEEGTDLSGGQWQKIAIARMYMRQIDVVMLDEPTAALDAESEHDIYERFASIVRDRVSILISHRFSTVRMADKIAVIEEGTVKEYGSHQDLMSLGGTYARLYSYQAKQYDI